MMKSPTWMRKELRVMITCLSIAAAAPGYAQDAPEAPAPPPNTMRLLLPPEIYAVPGIEMNIYFENVALVLDPARYVFDVVCSKGSQQSERWTFTPTPEDVGTHPLTLSVRDEHNTLLATARTAVIVTASDAGADRELSMLIVGDSLTNASVYTGHILHLCDEGKNPTISLVGSHGPAANDGEKHGGNRHEGYGGWTAQRFATHYTGVAREGPYKERGSPFIYKDGDEKPKLDFMRYCAEFNHGKPPNVVTILLGCNDTFGADESTIEERIDTMFKHYDTVVSMIHQAAPDALVGALLLVPPAATQDAFGANYKCGQTRWQYRRNQHRVVERMLEHFAGRENENLFLVPAVTNLDCRHNYPTRTGPVNARTATKTVRQANGVHPAAEGYRQIGDTIYCWLKYQLAKSTK